jgi:hypothetical protein
MRSEVPTQIHSFWRTTAASCELVCNQASPARLLVWSGARIVYERVVTSYMEASALAAELKVPYA